MPPSSGDQNLISYRTLRRLVGILGVALPIVLAVWGFALRGALQIEPSISDYYALRTRDALVGILFTMAWFLFTYRAYERNDEIAGKTACLAALGVALFPNSGTPAESRIHFASAAVLFVTLACFSLFLFTKSQGVRTPQKRIRNGIYRGCGITILMCIALIGLYKGTAMGTSLGAWQPVFWLESLALWAFGVSWFIKGETLFRDPA